mmetsp:Transcript_49445/g.107687  ORF Transcript_49445/g.107687 Transcript_49445/m.107687 type:complete len:97 (+) Transcript_49445:72-362(+)
MASVDDLIQANELIVFATSTCPFCTKAIAAIKEAGYEANVTFVDSAQREQLQGKTGKSSVPQVFIKGQFVGGCNDGGLGGALPLLQNGKFAELMGR